MNRERALQLLRAGKAGISEWNDQRPQPVFALTGLQGVVDLAGADLEGEDLSFSDLRHVDFTDARLDDSRLFGADLSAANLTRASLRGSQLVGARLKFSKLKKADLRGANLTDSILLSARLDYARLDGAILNGAFLLQASLQGAVLENATAQGAFLLGADLCGADLRHANLTNTNFNETDLRRADLQGAILRRCSLVNADLTGAVLTEALVYGLSAWGVQLDDCRQNDLVITDEGEPIITLDNLELAQFVYLLLNNQKIRGVIDTLTTTVVLVLGRFSAQNKQFLNLIREELRNSGYAPVLFDFEKPRSRAFVETVSILAHLSRFVLADVTDAKVVLEEVPHIVRNVGVPVQPLVRGLGREPTTIQDLRRNHPMLMPTHQYHNADSLTEELPEILRSLETVAGRVYR